MPDIRRFPPGTKGLGYHAQTRSRIVDQPANAGWAIENRRDDQWPGDVGREGCRTEVVVPKELTGYGSAGGVTDALWYVEIGGDGPTPTETWSARLQGHAEGGGQAPLFVCTPGGKWMVRAWDLASNRQKGMYPIIGADGKVRSYEPGETLAVWFRYVYDPDPSKGRLHLYCDGIEVCDVTFATAKSAGGTWHLKGGLYRKRGTGPAVVNAWVRNIVQVIGVGDDFDALLEAAGHEVIDPAPPPTLPPTDPCAPLRADLAASRAEAESLALARDAALALAAARQRRLSAVITAAMDDPDDPAD